MSDKRDRYQDAYLKGDIRINYKTLAIVTAIISVLVLVATVASNRRKAENVRMMEAKMDALIAKHGNRLAALAESVYNAETYNPYYDSIKFHEEDRNLKEFDVYLRENFSFARVGFSVGFIVPHKSGEYAFIGPGGFEYNGTPWHFNYFGECAEEMLTKGKCTSKEGRNDDNYYSFRVIKKPGTSVIAAVFIAAKIEHSNFD